MKINKMIILVTSMAVLLGLSALAYADESDGDEEPIYTIETYEDSYETVVNFEETSNDNEIITDELIICEESDVYSIETYRDEDVEEVFLAESSEDVIEIEDEVSEEIEETEDAEEITYDVQGFELYGWWVPSLNYNADDTISFYLEDNTCFLTTPTAGVQCGDSIWQSSGLWSYVEMTYGGENNLSGDEYQSYLAVQDYLI